MPNIESFYVVAAFTKLFQTLDLVIRKITGSVDVNSPHLPEQ